MEDFERGVTTRPVRQRVVTQPSVNAQPQEAIVNKTKPKEGYHNPKFLTLTLLILACVGLCCFFLVPVYWDKITVMEQSVKVKVKLLEFLAEKGSLKIAASLMLVGYSVVIFNSLLNLWHNKKVECRKLFVTCNFVAVIASIMTLICGFYAIFSLGYTPISLITIAIIASLVVVQSMAFLRCKVLEEKLKKKYKNSKALTIINMVLLLVFAVLVAIQLFGFGYEVVWEIGIENGLPIYGVHSYKCIDALYESSFGTTMFLGACAILLFHIVNNIILLISKKVQESKYGFVSKIICAILSIFYLIFGIFAIVKINNYNAEFFVMVLACIVSVIITIVSILQAVKSKEKE